ncbi:hypothetical protein BLA24064_03350 [Burkholderia latens]|uniref:Uncharacterized protein n=1 Tax=Burkholderia latens TaxID=488446 RepID=A0A6P2LJ41_9BURK|nr:hypothetical protein BLA24064_03350 [Burkholderia latens]
MAAARDAPLHLSFQHIVAVSDEQNLMRVNGKRCTWGNRPRAFVPAMGHERGGGRHASRNDCAPSASATVRNVASARFSICRTRSRDIPASCAIAS